MTDTYLSHIRRERIIPTCCHIVLQLIVLLICSAHITAGSTQKRGLDRQESCAGENSQKCTEWPNQQRENQALGRRGKEK